MYSGQFIDKDEAEREFREFLGPSADGCTANHIRMRIGRCRNAWVKNCVAIGLSGGFVEPLESTGIFFIQHGIEELVSHFPGDDGLDPNMIASYNKIINECIDGVREFLTIHYHASDRDDTPFWRATKHVRVPDSLRERLEIWKSRLPTQRTIYQPFHGFEMYSWSVMLLGLNYRPKSHLPSLDLLDARSAEATFQAIKVKSLHLVRTLPSQYEYLTQLRSQSEVRRPVRRSLEARFSSARTASRDPRLEVL